jgi:hypothetical protein
MPKTAITQIAVIGIEIGKSSFLVVGLDRRGAIVLRQKWSRGQVGERLVNMPPCLIGMEACVGAHHLSRKLKALGHDLNCNYGRSAFTYWLAQIMAAFAAQRAGATPSETNQWLQDLAQMDECSEYLFCSLAVVPSALKFG